MSRSYKKPWVKDSQPRTKRIQNRRYRRVVRQDVKQWRNRYYYNIIRDCPKWECLEDENYWECRACLSFELEPSYPHPHKFNDTYDVCDWRMYRDSPSGRRK